MIAEGFGFGNHLLEGPAFKPLGDACYHRVMYAIFWLKKWFLDDGVSLAQNRRKKLSMYFCNDSRRVPTPSGIIRPVAAVIFLQIRF